MRCAHLVLWLCATAWLLFPALRSTTSFDKRESSMLANCIGRSSIFIDSIFSALVCRFWSMLLVGKRRSSKEMGEMLARILFRFRSSRREPALTWLFVAGVRVIAKRSLGRRAVSLLLSFRLIIGCVVLTQTRFGTDCGSLYECAKLVPCFMHPTNQVISYCTPIWIGKGPCSSICTCRKSGNWWLILASCLLRKITRNLSRFLLPTQMLDHSCDSYYCSGS